MFLLSTILYFGDNPVGYDVFREKEIFYFHPALDTQSRLQPPLITARYIDAVCAIEGVEHPDVREQIGKLVGMNSLVALPGKMSAAS